MWWSVDPSQSLTAGYDCSAGVATNLRHRPLAFLPSLRDLPRFPFDNYHWIIYERPTAFDTLISVLFLARNIIPLHWNRKAGLYGFARSYSYKKKNYENFLFLTRNSIIMPLLFYTQCQLSFVTNGNEILKYIYFHKHRNKTLFCVDTEVILSK